MKNLSCHLKARSRAYRALWITSLILVFAVPAAKAEKTGLAADIRQIRMDHESQFYSPQIPIPTRAKLLARFGDPDAALDFLEDLKASDPLLSAALSTEVLMRAYRFPEAEQAIAELRKLGDNDDLRRMDYRWWFLTENLSAVDSSSRYNLKHDKKSVVDLLADADLSYRLLDMDKAEDSWSRALQYSTDSRERASAVLGISRVLFKRHDFQTAFDTLMTLVNPEDLNDDIIFELGVCLIQLSRTSEAIDLFTEAALWNPWNERAHYYLGNGFTRLNYSQLKAEHPENFGDQAAKTSLALARKSLASGDKNTARIICMPLLKNSPKLAEPPVLLGSMAWSEGDFDSAAVLFRMAVNQLPEYGRARNGLAKAMEGLRARFGIYRDSDEAEFAAMPMPDVPGIEEYVKNWSALSPRHQKRVALSVEPWKAYLPVLLEIGSHHYIKPLFEILSEAPGLETLKDARISYDSRLWDDVRGCGGFTTVTGIEDVERCIFYGYNTVLHELTHQVHYVFPPEDKKRIEDAFAAARKREDRSKPTFLSRYQASSEWEYLAEGANSYFSPKRNAYDTREIVRERLLEMDPGLVELVEFYLPAPHLEACYPVGLTIAAHDAVERQDLVQALSLAERAYERNPHADVVLAELSYIHSLLDHDSLAVAFADTLRELFPNKTDSYAKAADAGFFADGDGAAQVAILREASAVVDESEHWELNKALGKSLWYTGEYEDAADFYRQALDVKRDDSEALWGLAMVYGDMGSYAESDSLFTAAVQVRSGVLPLRLDYARMLIAAGRLHDAEHQIQEARLLAPDDPRVDMMEGWLKLQSGDPTQALELMKKALAVNPDDRLAGILTAEALFDSGQKDEARAEIARLESAAATDEPVWHFFTADSDYLPVRVWPQFQRALLKRFSDQME